MRGLGEIFKWVLPEEFFRWVLDQFFEGVFTPSDSQGRERIAVASASLVFQAQADLSSHALPPRGVLPSNSSLSLTPPQHQGSAEANSQRRPNHGQGELSAGAYPPLWTHDNNLILAVHWNEYNLGNSGRKSEVSDVQIAGEMGHPLFLQSH